MCVVLRMEYVQEAEVEKRKMCHIKGMAGEKRMEGERIWVTT